MAGTIESGARGPERAGSIETAASITVKSRAAELLMHSRRFEELNNRLALALGNAGVRPMDDQKSPSAPDTATEDERLPAILTNAVINNGMNLTTYEGLIVIVENELL